MEKISNLLLLKAPNFHTIGPAEDLDKALHQMTCENTDHLVVMGEDNRFLGILSDHDILSKGLLKKIPLQKLKVQDVIDNRYPIATLSDTLEKCMRLLHQHKSRFLAVFDNFDFRGILSVDDLLDALLHQRKVEWS